MAMFHHLLAFLFVDRTVCLRLSTSEELMVNPLSKIPAAKAHSPEQVLSVLPEKLQNMIKRLPAGRKGNCADDVIPESNASAEAEMPACKCPTKTDGGNSSPEVSKYAKRAQESGCDQPKGMWDSETAAGVIRYKYETIATMFNLGKNHRVLDWGSGCGHQLGLIAEKFNFHGVGIDLVPENTAWAKEHLGNELENFCTVDGAGGLHFAKSSFDLVISNAALYHLKGFDAQCKVLKDEVPHVLVPGGCAWFGWLGSGVDSIYSGTIKPEAMAKCFDGGGFYASIINEQKLFGAAEYSDQEAYSVIFCKSDAAA